MDRVKRYPLTSFIGRELELAEVKGLVTATRLLTLTGMGGCGKTRLALQAVQELSAEFADGVRVLELAELSDESLLPQLAAYVLGIPSSPDQTALESLLDTMRQRRMLLVLDNCEHVSAACARMADAVLTASPETHILATSREPLALPGELVYPLSGLALPLPATDLIVDDLIQFAAVRLFVERVRAILPGFELTEENAANVRRICLLLDGMPLALELASARGNVLTLHQIAERLDDRFSLLVSRQRGEIPPRHSSLRAAIDWSYDLLSPSEQKLLQRISVFASGCSLAAAEAVCAGEGIESGEMLDLVSGLVEKSLALAHTQHGNEARYQLHETIRQYAQEKLVATGEFEAICTRHLDYYVIQMEQAADKLTGPYQQVWLSWLDGEYGEVRAALAWSLESGRVEAGMHMAIAIYQYWVIRDFAEEGLSWVERLLGRADEEVSLPVQANALAYAAFLAGFRGNSTAQSAYGREAAKLAETAGEAGRQALRWALAAQAYGSHAESDFESELSLDERVIQLNRELGDAYQLGLTLSIGSFAAMALGRYDRAQAMLEESLPLLRQAGNPYRIAMALNFTGDLRRLQGDYPGAKEIYEESIALLREIEAVRDLASALHNLGHTCLHMGDSRRARALFEESLSLQQAQANRAGMAECLLGFAALAVAEGNVPAGARLLAAAKANRGKPVASGWAATRMEYERTLTLIHERLAPQDFNQESAAGRMMSLEGAARYARNLPYPAYAGALAVGEDFPAGLTRREKQIVALVARGKSNGEIADELVVSKRTVEKHIAHIMMKLGATNRSQVVLWGIEHGSVTNSEIER